MSYDSLRQQSQLRTVPVESKFFARVMTWMVGAFLATGVGIFLLGPLIPPSMVLPLSLLALGVLLVASFIRQNRYLAGPLAIVIPVILGAVAYPLLNYYVASGAGSLVVMAAAGALVIFGGMAIWGWTTPADVSGWGKPLFFVTLGLIAVSLLNIFIGASWLALIVAMAVLAVFSLWTVYDVQSLKNAEKYGTEAHPATYALNLWLNIWNIFLSLLRIFSAFR